MTLIALNHTNDLSCVCCRSHLPCRFPSSVKSARYSSSRLNGAAATAAASYGGAAAPIRNSVGLCRVAVCTYIRPPPITGGLLNNFVECDFTGLRAACCFAATCTGDYVIFRDSLLVDNAANISTSRNPYSHSAGHVLTAVHRLRTLGLSFI